MLVGGEVGLPDAGEQLGEGGVAGQVGAQDEGVHEEADQVFEAFVGAPRDRCAQRDVRSGAEPVQQRGDGRLGDHEHADAMTAGQRAQVPGPSGVDGQSDGATAVAALRRPGPVGGQREFLRQAREGVLPVGELAGLAAVRPVGFAECLAVPEGVVGVLHGQGRPRGRVSRTAGLVGEGQVAPEGAVGPLVAA